MHRKRKRHYREFRKSPKAAITAALFASVVIVLGFSSVTAQQTGTPAMDQAPIAGLSGNWVARNPNADGTSRDTYFNLKADGSRITGTIRVTQFYYLITESTGGDAGFTITGTMKDGKSERKVQYEGKL